MRWLLLFATGCLPAVADTDPCSDVVAAFGEGQWLIGKATVAWKMGQQAEGTNAAMEAAKAELQSKVCTGLSSEDCGLLMRNSYVGRGTPVVDRSGRVSCSVYGIPRGFVGSYTPERSRAEQAMDAAANRLKTAIQASGSPRLKVGRVLTTEGCAAAELDVVRQRFLSAFSGLPVVEEGAEAEVTLSATLNGNRISLLASWREKEAILKSETVEFSSIAYGISELPQRCVADSRLGTSKKGSVPLELTASLVDATACPGEQFSMALSTGAPARVHVYSVLADGTAWHIWPAARPEVSGHQDLGENMALPAPGGDESLVAVAVPVDAPTTAMDRQAGFCKLRGGFEAGALPANASVARLTWRVDARDCKAPDAQVMQQLENAVEAAPECR